jgi:ubiquinol oxidase
MLGGSFLAMNLQFMSHMISPRLTYRTLGYLEDEAVYTYTIMLDQLKNGELPSWTGMTCPSDAVKYY